MNTTAPNSAVLQALRTKAAAAHRVGEYAAASTTYRELLMSVPNDVDSWVGLGDALLALSRLPEAIDSYRKAIEIRPSHSRARYNLGIALRSVGNLHAAADAFRTAGSVDPKLYQAHANLGVILHDLGDWKSAAAAYHGALAINAEDVETLNNLAILHRDLGEFDRAHILFERALQLAPTLAEAHRNHALLHLLEQNFAKGWEKYEWRWRCQTMGGAACPFPQPRWDFSDLKSDSGLLVWSEQGLGDEILFAGMLDDVARLNGRVLWECDPRLVPLLVRSSHGVSIVPRSSPPDSRIAAFSANVQCPAGSLGTRFRRGLADFPVRRGYLAADPKRVADIRAQIERRPGEHIIGISWHSRNAEMGRHKSIPLADWTDLLDVPGARYVSLQYGDTRTDREALAARGRAKVDIMDSLDLTKDIDGLAALITACDLVITVSNTTAHLAAALGVETWVLIPPAAGKLWYWGHSGSSSPWYAAARLFRTDRDRLDANALNAVTDAVRHRLGLRQPPGSSA